MRIGTTQESFPTAESERHGVVPYDFRAYYNTDISIKSFDITVTKTAWILTESGLALWLKK
jgi:hypothetical protein